MELHHNRDSGAGAQFDTCGAEPKHSSSAWTVVGLLLVCLLGGLLAAGCKSPPAGGEGSIAWVEITNHSRLQITDATKAVLVRQGYHFIANDDNELIFDKPGSTWNQVTWGGWGEPMTARIKVDITRLPDDHFLLHCRVFMIRQLGDPVFEDKTKLTRMSSKPYQEYLDQVKTALESKPAAAPGDP